MSVAVIEMTTPQQELRWTPETHQEVISGHLVMSGRLSVVARLYLTSAGRILCLWPDKLHTPPLGCANLRDTIITCSDETRCFILRHRLAEDLTPLSLSCAIQQDYQRWKKVLLTAASGVEQSGTDSRRKLFASQYVTRLPMLVEEDGQ